MSWKRFKLFLGVAGGLLFYSWEYARYLPLLAGMVVAAYLIVRLVDRFRERPLSTVIFIGGIVLFLGTMVSFKLFPDIKYPLGLSYLTFQIIACFVDARKSADNCEKDFLKFSFYLLLFPKIPAGPIVPYRSIKPQLDDLKSDPRDMADGLRRFLAGFIKKVLIADMLGTVVVPVFNLPSPVIEPRLAWLVIASYSLQLFFDFSGYVDMAIGIGQMMGVRLMENFNAPYLSLSIGEFWRRWHISLSTWFREIVFYPLERRRIGRYGQQVNILVVFILTGLWHGLTRNFLLWGIWHGAALVFESSPPGRQLRSLPKFVQRIYALGVVVIGWVIFRSPTPDFALDYLRRLVGDVNGIQRLPFEVTSPLPFIEPTFLIAFTAGVLLCLPWKEWLLRLSFDLDERLVFRFAADAGLAFLFLAALGSAASAAYQPGIYGGF